MELSYTLLTTWDEIHEIDQHDIETTLVPTEHFEPRPINETTSEKKLTDGQHFLSCISSLRSAKSFLVPFVFEIMVGGAMA